MVLPQDAPLECSPLPLHLRASCRFTCVIKWFRARLQWICYDGLYAAATLASLPASRVVASFTYPAAFAAAWVPPGDEDSRVHINLWSKAGQGAAPSTGRRVHAITTGFEFTPADVNTGAAPAEYNVAWRAPQMRALAAVASREHAATQAGGDETVSSASYAASGIGRRLEGSNGSHSFNFDVQMSVARPSSGDPSGAGHLATMQVFRLKEGELPDAVMRAAAASMVIPEWAAADAARAGYYVSNGAYVSPEAASRQMQLQQKADGSASQPSAAPGAAEVAATSEGGTGGGGLGTGATVGLSVLGFLVGLLSLFAAGIVIRRRARGTSGPLFPRAYNSEPLRTSISSPPNAAAPAGDHQGASGAQRRHSHGSGDDDAHQSSAATAGSGHGAASDGAVGSGSSSARGSAVAPASATTAAHALMPHSASALQHSRRTSAGAGRAIQMEEAALGHTQMQAPLSQSHASPSRAAAGVGSGSGQGTSRRRLSAGGAGGTASPRP